MDKSKDAGISFFEKYLTVWVVLVEVPVMLVLVKIANKTKGWFSADEAPANRPEGN